MCAFAQSRVIVTSPTPTPFDDTQVTARVNELALAQGARLRDLRKRKGLTIDDLAQRSGLHFNTVGRIERGVSDASLAQLYVMALALGVDPAELNPFQTAQPASPLSNGLDDETFVLVELLDVRVSAGGGSFNGSQEDMGRFAFNRAWMARKGVKPAYARIVHARGDSMADKINNGDILLVDTATKSLDQDGVYVIQLDGHDYVKVLQRDFSTGGLQIISYNPAYKPQVLSAEQAAELHISGRVVWHGGEI
ncbi:putative HTH-type transcriptional regulator [Variovorax boronicumulans]|nr:putative HTH-type transcriptional regulator [Variovorax boronicumulans]